MISKKDIKIGTLISVPHYCSKEPIYYLCLSEELNTSDIENMFILMRLTDQFIDEFRILEENMKICKIL